MSSWVCGVGAGSRSERGPDLTVGGREGIGTIGAVVPRPGTLKTRGWAKLGTAIAACAVIGAGCAPGGTPPNFPVAQGQGLLISVVDNVNDAGRMPSAGIDSHGHPAVAYLLLKQVPRPGLLPAPIVAGAPQPPAVILATQSGGIWKRISVTPQSTGPAQGEAKEIGDKDFHAIPGVNTGLAVDPNGKHHVVWATPSGLFYDDDVSGSFGTPEQVTKTAALGGAVAVGPDGAPWVSFYEGTTVMAATRLEAKWSVERVGAAGPGGISPASAPSPAFTTAIRVGSGGDPIVAYGVEGQTVLARRAGGSWTDPAAVPGPGGYGVSLALDPRGNPHVAYYDVSGGVHVAFAQGPASQPVALAATAPGPGGQADPAWSTGLAIDQDGTDYVTFANTHTHGVDLATNVTGTFASKPVPGSQNGANPSIAVSSDGNSLALAWYDPTNGNLDVATNPSGSLALAFSPQPVVGPTITPSAVTCQPQGATVQIVAPPGAAGSGFDQRCYAAAAGKAFTINFDNKDSQAHNFAIFAADPLADSSAKALFDPTATNIVSPGASTTYDVPSLQAGTYFFHCDIHPTTMTGTFVVAGGR